MAITQTLTPFPTPHPDRDEDTPTEFSDHVDATLGHLNTHITELDTWTEQANALAEPMNMEIGSMYVGTSSTSVEIGTGSKTFTVNESGKAFAATASIRIVDAADPNTKYMVGTVTSYDTGTKALVANITSTGGSGTLSNWLINVGGDCNRIQNIPVDASAPANGSCLIYNPTSGEYEPKADPTVKGWIHFKGTDTISIFDSYNVSSIVDNSTGNYTINWDTDFANADYVVVGGCGIGSVSVSNSTTYTVVSTYNSNGQKIDQNLIHIIAMGDQ